jgi:hypothetical protein
MHPSTIIWLLVVGGILLLSSLVLRVASGGKYEVKPAQPLTLGEDVHLVETARKGGLAELPRQVASRTEALAFTLGSGRYTGPAIRQYFEALSGSLQTVVLNNPDGTLFGVYDAAKLNGYLRIAGESRARSRRFQADCADAHGATRQRQLAGGRRVAPLHRHRATRQDHRQPDLGNQREAGVPIAPPPLLTSPRGPPRPRRREAGPAAAPPVRRRGGAATPGGAAGARDCRSRSDSAARGRRCGPQA